MKLECQLARAQPTQRFESCNRDITQATDITLLVILNSDGQLLSHTK